MKLVRGATQSGRKRGYHFLREEPSAGLAEGGERKREKEAGREGEKESALDTAKVDGKNV